MKQFFMVFVEGERNPTYQHVTLQSAEGEAKRLAEKTGKKSYVLCTVKSFLLEKFKTEDCRPDIDLPF